jgi:hypothetical protein
MAMLRDDEIEIASMVLIFSLRTLKQYYSDEEIKKLVNRKNVTRMLAILNE